jgi:hypothetical protein
MAGPGPAPKGKGAGRRPQQSLRLYSMTSHTFVRGLKASNYSNTPSIVSLKPCSIMEVANCTAHNGIMFLEVVSKDVPNRPCMQDAAQFSLLLQK